MRHILTLVYIFLQTDYQLSQFQYILEKKFDGQTAVDYLTPKAEAFTEKALKYFSKVSDEGDFLPTIPCPSPDAPFHERLLYCLLGNNARHVQYL